MRLAKVGSGTAVKRNFRSTLAIAAAFLLMGSTSASDELPVGWQRMEIESKWDITPEQYSQLVNAFRDGTTGYGYTFEVRWNGVPRRFVDTYYDSLSGELSADLHTLRHRARYRSNIDVPSDEEGRRIVSEHDLDRADWGLEWESIQYKSDPCRIDATWFREETGECRLRDLESDADGSRLCVPGRQIDPADMLAGNYPAHDAISALRRDHPTLAMTSLRPALHVSDYRYRVTIAQGGRRLFELSLDRLYTTNLITGSRALPSFEAELEIIADNQTAEDVRRLLALSQQLQRDFGLTPSTRSKGLVEAQVGSCRVSGGERG